MDIELFRDDDRGIARLDREPPRRVRNQRATESEPRRRPAAPCGLLHDQRPAGPGQDLDRALHQGLLQLIWAPAGLGPQPPESRSRALRFAMPATHVISESGKRARTDKRENSEWRLHYRISDGR